MRILTLLFLVVVLMPLKSHALDCPTMPDQARKDWEVEVKAAVGRIGPAKGAELETLTKTVTRDLMGKLPQADKVYLEQMMYASYCSALRDDRTLSESEKAGRIKAYNLEVRKTLFGPQSKTQGPEGREKQGSLRPDEARIQLGQLSLPYTAASFVQSAERGDAHAVRLFLTAGMDPNTKDSWGSTALVHAVDKGDTRMIDILLKAKADVNEKVSGGDTALSRAVYAGNVAILRVLVSSGANGETINDAFVTAAGRGRRDILRILLDRGADINKFGSRALRRAVELLGPSDEMQSDTIRFLLDLGVAVNAKDAGGWTALHSAAHRWGGGSTLSILLDRGADINATCDECRAGTSVYTGGGWTPLMIATSEHRENTVKTLLDRGADVNKQNDRGKTALMLAVGNAAIAQVFLERGADVNVKDNDGRTALMWGARYGDIAVVRGLLERGARVNEKDVKGKTAPQLAEERSDGETKTEMVRLLRGAAAN